MSETLTTPADGLAPPEIAPKQAARRAVLRLFGRASIPDRRRQAARRARSC